MPTVPTQAQGVFVINVAALVKTDQLAPESGSSKCPTCQESERLDTKVSGELFKEVASLLIPEGDGFAWHLGALDPVQVHGVEAQYRDRYAALDLDWLLQALAELRFEGEPG